jgi:hemolysin D
MVQPLAASAAIAATRSHDYAKLLQGNYVGRHDYLLREQERIAAERDLAAQRSRLAELRSGLSEAQQQLHVLTNETRQQTLDQLRQAQEQKGQFGPDVAKAVNRDRLMELRAPVDGTVQQLAVHTNGGVVTPAQPLLTLVPSGEGLEVEMSVLNKDVGFVRHGQTVTIKVESFPYTRFGYVVGTVESVSHDAAQDEKLGLVFPARVRLSSTHLGATRSALRLSPGMSVTAEMETGHRRIIDYLLSPIEATSQESLREQ